MTTFRRISSLLAATALVLGAVWPAASAAPAPMIRIAADPPVLNPTGEGAYTSSTLSLISSEFTAEQALTVQIEDPGGKVVRTLPMTGAGDSDPATYTVAFDGKDAAGANLADGTYTVRVVWNGSSYVYTLINVDSVLPQLVSARVTPDPFGQTARIQAQFSEPVSWLATIYDEWGRYVVARQGHGEAADDLWDGRDHQGNQVPDGTYRIEFRLHDHGPNEVKADGPKFRRKQSVGIKDFVISRKVISPGRPETGTASITVTVTDEVTYRWDLLDAGGIPLRSIGGGAAPGTALKVVFDGRDGRGNLLPAGRYRWTLVIRDAYGNTSTGNGDFTVDPDAPTLTAGPTPVVTKQEMLYLPFAAFDPSGTQVTVQRILEKGWTETLRVDATAAELAIPLVVGTQTVSIIAVDGAGNPADHTFVITRVAEPTLGVFVAGRPVVSEVAPEIAEGRTVLPLRAVAEALGFAIHWDQATQTIAMSKGGKQVVMSIGSKVAKVDGKSREMEVAPFIRDGRTMVPVRFISEGLGFSIIWDEETRSVIIE